MYMKYIKKNCSGCVQPYSILPQIKSSQNVVQNPRPRGFSGFPGSPAPQGEVALWETMDDLVLAMVTKSKCFVLMTAARHAAPGRGRALSVALRQFAAFQPWGSPKWMDGLSLKIPWITGGTSIGKPQMWCHLPSIRFHPINPCCEQLECRRGCPGRVSSCVSGAQ